MSAHLTRKRARSDEEEEDLPPTKRELPDQNRDEGAAGSAQTEDRASADGEVSKEDEEFWFEDGTVILVARDVKFRFYEGLLAGLSPVFKDMFAERRANPGMGEVLALSCLVVHVSDSPEDLRHLLRVCFSRRLGSLYEERSPSYDEISAAIRLGDKYKITDLYSQSLAYLKRYFPSNFDSWNALSVCGPPGWETVEDIGAINLARFTGELSILPSAFVACICAGPEATGIGHGIARKDVTHEHLSPDDLTVCFNGKTGLRMATVTAFLRTMKPTVSQDCTASSACRRALREVLLNLEEHIEYLLSGNPFAGYEKVFGTRASLAVCSPCSAMVRERSLKERKDVWDRLPELLGIDVPGWKEQPPPPPLSHK
ncbi:hypothetical protein LXA43DRAFT_39965 [Ganoderma leucocontextum]|nr:hypothetical protein LXA43DRAFT_39965 [Ganoderma leucocontextum]